MSTHKGRIARKYVNVMDSVREEHRTLVPAFTAITKVSTGDTVAFTREKQRDSSFFTEEWNDLTLKDLVKSGLLGQNVDILR